MNAATLKQWAGQITTGIGAVLATPTVIALLSHQITWQEAIPPLVASIIALVWPENKALAASGQTTATDIEGLLTAYRTGLQHGASTTPIGIPTPPPAA